METDLTGDINNLWQNGERKAAITALHSQLNQVTTTRITSQLWTLYKARQHEFVVAWVNDPAVKFEWFVGDL